MRRLTTLALAQAVACSLFAFYVVLGNQRTIVAGPFVDADVCNRIAQIMNDADPQVFPICVYR